MSTAFGTPLTPEDEAIFDRAMTRSATLQRRVERPEDERIDADRMADIDSVIKPEEGRFNLRSVFLDNGRFR